MLWDGRADRFLETVRGEAVTPDGIAVEGSADGSRLKAYSHFCFEGLLKAARLMNLVMGFSWEDSSVGMWK